MTTVSLPLPAGPYSLIVADPAIKYKNKAARGAAEDHYETMTIEEIARLPVEEIAADDAMLGLWIPMSIDPAEGMLIMRLWGFRYVTRIPWVKMKGVEIDESGFVRGKPQMGPGNYVRNCCEELFIGVRGKATAPEGAKDELGVIFAERTREHSEKPSEAYAKLARIAPPGQKLEMFARVAREGWDRWGREAPPPTEAETRRVKAAEAVAEIGAVATQRGASKLTEAKIEEEIKATRTTPTEPVDDSPAWLRSKPKTVWQEDDATPGLPGHEYISDAWQRLYGEPLKIHAAIEQYDGGDAMFYLMPQGRIACTSYPGGAAIYEIEKAPYVLTDGAAAALHYGFEPGNHYVLLDGQLGQFAGTSREFLFFNVISPDGTLRESVRYGSDHDCAKIKSTDPNAAIQCPSCDSWIAAEAAEGASACPFCGAGA